jgi:molybdopterin-containing oxidoreductase family membrane subunit
MVLNLAIPARAWFGLKDIITLRHIENCCKILLATGCIVGYAYSMEFFIAWYSGQIYERFAFMNRALGPFAWSFWLMVFCNVVAPQFMWSKRLRKNLVFVFIIATFANAGMWFERFVIIVTSLTRDFLPSSWWTYRPTWVDMGMLAGSFGLFFTLFMLFCRYLPVVAMAEVKSIMPQAHAHADGDDHDDHAPDLRQGDYRPSDSSR